jgi:hypothetical protein
MYGDNDAWPIKCPKCLDEFTDSVGRIKARGSNCPFCGLAIRYPRVVFSLALEEANSGRFDPWASMARLRPDS